MKALKILEPYLAVFTGDFRNITTNGRGYDSFIEKQWKQEIDSEFCSFLNFFV